MKLKDPDPDPNPGVINNVLATIGELAQVGMYCRYLFAMLVKVLGMLGEG